MTGKHLRSFADIPRDRPVWLYGAGGLGQRACAALHDGCVLGFIDQVANREIGNLPVLSLDVCLAQRAPDDIIVITSSYGNEIREELARRNVVEYLDASRVLLFEITVQSLRDDPVCTFARTHLRASDIVFDVGSNAGYMSAFFSCFADKVFAFEPEPEAIATFLSSYYGDDDKIFLMPMALGDRTGTAKLHLDEREMKSASSLHADNPFLSQLTVEVMTAKLDAVVAATGQRPTFIKIDVEGHEPAVIRGGWQTISQHRPLMVFEFQEVRWNTGFKELFDILEPHYSFIRLDDQAACLDEYRRGHFYHEVANIACLPR